MVMLNSLRPIPARLVAECQIDFGHRPSITIFVISFQNEVLETAEGGAPAPPYFTTCTVNLPLGEEIAMR